MIISLWRYAHLSLALVSFLFIMIASVTGAVLALEPIGERTKAYQVEAFHQIKLSESIIGLKARYPELMKLSINHHGFVTAEGFDEEGNEFQYIVHPRTGEILGKPLAQNEFMKWMTTMHRSLFMHETGRFIVGVFCFLLFLITITGLLLLIKRQRGLRRFFTKIYRDSSSQYYHTVLGRLMLLPLLIITLSGTYLFLLRFEVFKVSDISEMQVSKSTKGPTKAVQDYPAFKDIYLSEIKEVEFPFDDSPEEYYKVKTKKGEWLVSQVTGEKIEEVHYPVTKVIENLSLELHTGRSHPIWAGVLFIASLNILAFIYTGFAITLRRKSFNKIKNLLKKEDAKTILLVGSENGSTWSFAQKVYRQMVESGQPIYIAPMDEYEFFPKMEELLIFTSTYGKGEAPSNAKNFEAKLYKYRRKNRVKYAVVGFGSRAYDDYCGYALKVAQMLSAQDWAEALLSEGFVNDRSTEDFCSWIRQYNQVKNINLSEVPEFYTPKLPSLKTFKLLAKTHVSEEDEVFRLEFSTKEIFQSGDLLAIYPANDHRQRLYSIAKIDGKLCLMVKKHVHGLGSGYLYQLLEGQVVKARVIRNSTFHCPQETPVMFICNGTGIAPFLGMISENTIRKYPFYLYAGFRKKNAIVQQIMDLLKNREQSGKVSSAWAFSREQTTQRYVMDLIKKDEDLVFNFLQNGGTVMVCGSISMWRDVESLLNSILIKRGTDLKMYKDSGKILVDCY